MIKGQRTVSMDEFVDKVLPYTTSTLVDIQANALYEAQSGGDFRFIVRDVMFIVDKEDVLAYFKAKGMVNTFDTESYNDGFEDVVEKISKKPIGRPRKVITSEDLA